MIDWESVGVMSAIRDRGRVMCVWVGGWVGVYFIYDNGITGKLWRVAKADRPGYLLFPNWGNCTIER